MSRFLISFWGIKNVGLHLIDLSIKLYQDSNPSGITEKFTFVMNGIAVIVPEVPFAVSYLPWVKFPDK